jgi:hypothetical protein
MKYLTSLLFVLLATASGFTSAAAQTPVSACQVELLAAHERSRGKLARVGNALVFIDEPRMGHSFSINRSNIASAHEYQGVFSVYTRDWVRYHNVLEKHFTFTFFNNHCYAIAQWLNRPLAPVATRRYRAPSYYAPRYYAPREGGYYREGGNYYGEGPYSYGYARPRIRRVFGARQQRSFSPDVEGKLSITDRVIVFEPYSDNREPRQWYLRDIRRIERDGEHKLKIEEYGGDEYSFRIRDRTGLSNTTFRNLERIIYGGYYAR